MAVCAPAYAQSKFPTRPVRLILPFGPGGVADVTMRLLGQKLGEKWGQQVVIENKPGAGGVLAQQTLLASPADGYSMSVTGNGTAIGMTLFKNRPYDIIKDFTPVSITATFEMLLVTRRDAPFKTAGRTHCLRQEVSGQGEPGRHQSGLDPEPVGASVQADDRDRRHHRHVSHHARPDHRRAARRHRHRRSTSTPPSKAPLSDNQLRVLASADDERNPLLPNVPTAKESGLPDYVVTSWNALSAPAGLPNDILAILNRDIVAALADPDVRQKARDLGLNAQGSTPEEMRDRMVRDIKRWGEVIERAGVPKQ